MCDISSTVTVSRLIHSRLGVKRIPSTKQMVNLNFMSLWDTHHITNVSLLLVSYKLSLILVVVYHNLNLDQLCPTYRPVKGFLLPSASFCCSASILHTTYSYCNNLKFDTLDAGSPQCHFIMFVPGAGRFPYVHWQFGAKCLTGFCHYSIGH